MFIVPLIINYLLQLSIYYYSVLLFPKPQNINWKYIFNVGSPPIGAKRMPFNDSSFRSYQLSFQVHFKNICWFYHERIRVKRWNYCVFSSNGSSLRPFLIKTRIFVRVHFIQQSSSIHKHVVVQIHLLRFAGRQGSH